MDRQKKSVQNKMYDFSSGEEAAEEAVKYSKEGSCRCATHTSELTKEEFPQRKQGEQQTMVRPEYEHM